MRDLLNPEGFFRRNYIHQIKKTISAYSDTLLVIGEALQNSIDAVCRDPKLEKGVIQLTIDFDTEYITLTDNGIGFPPNLELLYLGGSDKEGIPLSMGKVGVGIKVTLFSSNYFKLKSNPKDSDPWHIEINNAHEFDTLDELLIPDQLPEDPNPLPSNGTQISYRLANNEEGENYLNLIVSDIINKCCEDGIDKGFANTAIKYGIRKFPSAFAALFTSYLKRYSYIGDVLNSLGAKENYPENGIELKVNIKCSNPIDRFGETIGQLFGDESQQEFRIEPSYLHVEDTVSWVPSNIKSPNIFDESLGNGGEKLERTANGFNSILLLDEAEFETLLINKRGNLPDNIAEYRRKLFPKINGIILTIGRIPDFKNYLPGGSRRIISCNGVVTSHNIDLTSGRNQEYVRCFDLIIDLSADLNYGKNQLTNMFLVKYVRDYINDAYSRVIQNAAGNWVGKIPKQEDEIEEFFVSRVDLGLDEFQIKKIPKDENDVIALFSEMLGKKMFVEYHIFGLSQASQYDCKAAIKRECDNDDVFNPIDDSRLRTVEFKLTATSLVHDFERHQKFPRDIDLLICWDIGEVDSNRYNIYDIEYSVAFDASPKKVFPKATKFIEDSRDGIEVQILCLSEIVNDLKE